MNTQIIQKIVGPPGTGKTFTCMAKVENFINEGYRHEDILFVTFTRKAAAEARARAIDKFSLATTEVGLYSTLHSLAFRQMGMGRHQIMGFADYTKICGQLGIFITFKSASEDGTVTALSKGDRLFFAENMARAQLMDLKSYWEAHPEEDLRWYELEQLQQTLLDYKKCNGKHDFTDIITLFNASPACPNVRVLIVDEAQDLTPLQWQMVKHLAKNVEKIVIAGDDDQAIFHWAGADSDYFRRLGGSTTVLPQSFRIPKVVQEIAETIVSRISQRIPKQWAPAPHAGLVEHVTHIDQIDMSKGSWLLLGRNLFALQQYQNYCMQMGYVFDSQLGSPIKGQTLQAIIFWEKLRKGSIVPVLYIKMIYDLMSTKEKIMHGHKGKLDKLPDTLNLSLATLQEQYGLLTNEIWHMALDRISTEEREYFLSALRRGEKLLREPRIKISTIHGVKGGEADNVVICPDMAERTYREYQINPDDEHRVWYVGVTRAKTNLYLMQNQSNKYYAI